MPGLTKTIHMYVCKCAGLARIIYMYIQCTYGVTGREITEYMVIYGADIRFWPTLHAVWLAVLLAGDY